MRTTLTSFIAALVVASASFGQTKMTTNNIQTGAPSNLVNLASNLNGTSGSSVKLLDQNAVFGVTGTLGQSNGGTGAGALTCTNQFITSNGTLYSCVTATLASAQFANQGTTTTVLHGNAAGNPSWAGVSLTADTSANQGTTSQVLIGNAAGQPSWGVVPANANNVQHDATLTGAGTTGSNLGINLTNGNTWTSTQTFNTADLNTTAIITTGNGTGVGAQLNGGSPAAAGTVGGAGATIAGGTSSPPASGTGTAGAFGVGVTGSSGGAGVSTGGGGAGGDGLHIAAGGGGNGTTTGPGGNAGVVFHITSVAAGGNAAGAGAQTGGNAGDLFNGFTLGTGGAGAGATSTAGTGGGLGTWTLGAGGLGASAAGAHGGNGGGWVLNTGGGGGNSGGTGLGGNGGSIFITLGNAGGSSAGGGTGGAFSVTAGNGGNSTGGGGGGGGITFIAGNGNSTNGSGANITHTGGNGSGTATNGSGLISASGSGGTGTLHGYAAEFVQNNAVNGHLLFTGIASNPTHAADGSEWYITNTAFRFFQNATAVSLLNTGTNTTDNAATLLPSGTGSYTHSSTAATARAGWRFGDTRIIKWTSNNGPADCAGGTLNLTVAQLLDQGGFVTCATAQTINFPTWQGASGIVQNLPGTPAIGDVVGPFRFVATAANALTIGLGTGGTNGGANLTVAASTTRDWYCRLTNVTASSEAATCY